MLSFGSICMYFSVESSLWKKPGHLEANGVIKILPLEL